MVYNKESWWDFKEISIKDYIDNKKEFKKKGWQARCFLVKDGKVRIRKPTEQHLKFCKIQKDNYLRKKMGVKMDTIYNGDNVKNDTKNVEEKKEELDKIEWWKDEF